MLYFYSVLYFNQKYIDPNLHFPLALFPPHCLCGGELFKSCTHAKNNKILYEIRNLSYFANYLS